MILYTYNSQRVKLPPYGEIHFTTFTTNFTSSDKHSGGEVSGLSDVSWVDSAPEGSLFHGHCTLYNWKSVHSNSGYILSIGCSRYKMNSGSSSVKVKSLFWPLKSPHALQLDMLLALCCPSKPECHLELLQMHECPGGGSEGFLTGETQSVFISCRGTMGKVIR